jgi:transposase
MSGSRESAKSGAKRTRHDYTPEFKQEAVRVLTERRLAGVSLRQISREMDVPHDLLRNWAIKLGQWELAGAAKEVEQLTPEQELQRLRRENEVLRQERDFLKKATAFFAKESR